MPSFAPIDATIRPKKRPVNIRRIARVAELADQLHSLVRDTIVIVVGEFPNGPAGRDIEGDAMNPDGESEKDYG